MAAKIGELQYIKSVLVNTHVFGVVTDGDTPDGFAATFEITGDNGVLVVPALVGDPGVPGQNAFALRLQLSTIDDPLDLPETLTDTDADIGKYWMIDDLDADGNVIGSSAYIWFGDHYRRMMMGSPGPAGPVPIITPSFQLVTPDVLATYDIQVTGDAYHPHWNIRVNQELLRGPVGPYPKIRQATDIDFSDGPALLGQVLGWAGDYDDVGNQIFKFISIGDILPAPTTVPESAFHSYSGLSQRQTIGHYQCPPMPFDWKPWVCGQIQCSGLELSSNPLTIGAEVRLGDPQTGTLVARGFGTSVGQVTLLPHTSSPSSPDTSMTQSNPLAKVPANHTDPALGTLYINLYNDGIVGVYVFSPHNAQLSILQIPV